jgi:hypothetical protein
VGTYLSFREVKSRFAFIGVKHCTPYKDGSGYFIGGDRAKGAFPYATGPICHVAARADNAIIPEKVILNWFHQLCLMPKQIAMFWGVEDHGTEAENNREQPRS